MINYNVTNVPCFCKRDHQNAIETYISVKEATKTQVSGRAAHPHIPEIHSVLNMIYFIHTVFLGKGVFSWHVDDFLINYFK